MLHEFGEGQVEIITAEDQVLADSHALELHLAATLLAGMNQRKVGRAAADITNQDFFPGLNCAVPLVMLRINPGVKCGLWLFDQHDPRQFGERGRAYG